MKMRRETGPVTVRPLRHRSTHPPVGNPFRSDARGLSPRHPFAPHRRGGSVVFEIILFLSLLTSAVAAGQPAQKPKTQWDGSRTTPVHLIPLKDAFDQQIIPNETNPLPF